MCRGSLDCEKGLVFFGTGVRAVTRHLQEEEPLRGLLDEFVRHVFRVELSSELDQQRVLPLYILRRHLGGGFPQQGGPQ